VETTPNIHNLKQEESVDLKMLFIKFFRYWYFFALTIFVALVIAFLFNKYTKPVYEVKTTVLVKDDRSSKDLIGIGIYDMQNLQNEIGILSSYSLAERTINNLNFEITYQLEENFITTELYDKTPFIVEMDTNTPQLQNVKFTVLILSNTQYRLELQVEEGILYHFSEREEKGNITGINFTRDFNFGDQVEGEFGKFRIYLTEEFSGDYLNKNLIFIFNDYQSLISQFQGIKVEPIKRDASIVEISIRGSNKCKMKDYLNELTYQYLYRGIEKKNQIADNTIRFINFLYLLTSRIQLFRVLLEYLLKG
jgi:tyrosine-protein kinase Etk/Wzc